MKAVRLTNVGASLEEQEIAKPRLGANDVLVRIKAAGICHSDAHYRAGASSTGHLPLTLGHETASEVEDVADKVMNFRPDDRVCAPRQ